MAYGQRYQNYPPASFDQRWGPYDLPPVPDDARDELRRRLEQDMLIRAPGGTIPGTRERLGDPTKIISQLGQLPPSLGSADRVRTREAIPSGSPEQIGAGAGNLSSSPTLDVIEQLLKDQRLRQGIPGRQQGGPVVAGRPYVVGEGGPEVFLPQGFKWDQPEAQPSLPQGFKWDEPGLKAKTERFLEKVTPQGPISGLISLIRTAGQAAQGQRPDLLTNPEGAIPEVVQGSPAAMSSRGVPRMPSRLPEPYAPPEGPRLLPPPSPERIQAMKLEAARDAARAANRQYELRNAPPDVIQAGTPPGTAVSPAPLPPSAVPPQPPPSPLLPAQTVKEFGAVRKGVELSARLQALEARARLGNLSPKAMAALQRAIQNLKEGE